MERGLGALQAHLSPVGDSLQLHSVAAILLQSLQIHPALSLQQQEDKKKTLKLWHFYVTTVSLAFQSPVTVAVTAPAQPLAGLWESQAY